MRKVKSGGGWSAIRYTIQKGIEAGGFLKLWQALRTRNACKTCALGMGGQRGGMVNERGAFPEVCKKSLQAMTADMQGGIPADFWQTYSIEQLKKFTPYQLEHAGRLVQPVLYERDATHFRPVSWDEAMQRVAKRIKLTSPNQSFWYFSGRSSNEAGFLLQLFARVYGTNNVNNCSYYCHQASGVGMHSAIGSGTATIVLDDVEHADLVFLIGGNPASNHPRLMSTLKNVRRKGGEVVVVNPVIETGLVSFRIPSDPVSLLFGTKIATLYIQPHIGGDLAMLTGIAKRIVEMDAHDEKFLQEHCDGHGEYLAQLARTPWEEIYLKSGLSQKDIDDMAGRYAQAKNVVFSWTMGVTHHVHGVENVQAIVNLALLRGMIGRRHAGLMPIRGHSNVQGIGSVGVTPRLRNEIFDRLQSEFGVILPETAGKDTLACIEAAHAGEMALGFCLGGNLYGSNPDSHYAADALSRSGMLVYLNTTLNTGHAHGLADTTMILPVLARDEEPQPTTQESMFNYVRLSDGGPQRLAGPRSELAIIATLADSVLGNQGAVDWQAMRETTEVQKWIGHVVPGWEAIRDIATSRQEFQIEGRTFHQPQFPTATGRAKLHSHDIPSLLGSHDELRLMTVRSEGQFNTVVYEEVDLYRGIDRRDVILVHPHDISRLGFTTDEKVTVTSDTGSLPDITIKAFPEIRRGNALMYFPEANPLVARHPDPRSRTPAFKGVVISIQRNETTS